MIRYCNFYETKIRLFDKNVIYLIEKIKIDEKAL